MVSGSSLSASHAYSSTTVSPSWWRTRRELAGCSPMKSTDGAAALVPRRPRARRGERPGPAPESEHVVAGVRLVGDPPGLGRDGTEPARLVVLEGLDEFVPR